MHRIVCGDEETGVEERLEKYAYRDQRNVEMRYIASKEKCEAQPPESDDGYRNEESFVFRFHVL